MKIEEILALSSGTISELTGYKTYKQIDDITKKFIQFTYGVIASAPHEFENWQDAWKRFEKVYKDNTQLTFAELHNNPKEIQPL